MATITQTKEHIIDNIIKQITTAAAINENGYWYNAEWNLDLNNIRKTVTSSGTITTGTNEFGKKIVLTAEDWQQINEEFNGWISQVAECYRESEGRDGYNLVTGEAGVTWDVDYATAGWEGVTAEEDPADSVLISELGGWYDYRFVDIRYVTTNCLSVGGVQTFSFPINQHVLNYLSQFVPLKTTTTVFDTDLAEEVLDTTIFELLPNAQTRQARINKFFAEYETLKGEIPSFEDDVDDDGVPDTWLTDLAWNQDEFHNSSDISNPENIDLGNITRLTRHENDKNTNQSLEWLRGDIETHLTDIDKALEPEITDDRPEYENKSPGYLQIRGLNQSIIVRRQEGDDIGLIGDDISDPNFLRDGFTISMWVRFLDKTSGGTLFNFGAPLRKENPFGFMLETFVIGRDQQYRAPEYGSTETWGDVVEAPIGTGEGIGWPGVFFQQQDHERFIRLVVREEPTADNPRGDLRDSHTGASSNIEGFDTSRICTALETDDLGNTCDDHHIPHIYGSMVGNPEDEIWPALASPWLIQDYFPKKALTHTRVPYDKNEWYFIVANYNPNIKERVKHSTGDVCQSTGLDCSATGVTDLAYDSDYWRWNILYGVDDGCDGIEPTADMIEANPMLLYENGGGSSDGSDPCGEGVQEIVNVGMYTDFSGEGARCKVEIISKSDLLRAKGFKD